MAKFIDRLTKLNLIFAGVLLTSGFVAYANVQWASDSSDRGCPPQLQGATISKTELLFGLSKPDGASVTESEFQKFVNEEVTPRFPDGLTLMNATGQFKNSKNIIIKENTKLLLLLHQHNRENSTRIEQIREAYVKTFQQESVLRLDGQSCASF